METKTPTRRELFAGFFWLGLSGFGGVLPLAQRMLVEKRRWISDAEFAELLALGQLLPGPNIVNVAVAIGGRFAGAGGALSAVAGLLLAPMAAALTLAGLYGRYQHLPWMRQALHGLSIAAAGLVLGMAWKLLRALPRRVWSGGVALLAFALVGALGVALPIALAGLLPLAVLLSWWQREGGTC